MTRLTREDLEERLTLIQQLEDIELAREMLASKKSVELRIPDYPNFGGDIAHLLDGDVGAVVTWLEQELYSRAASVAEDLEEQGVEAPITIAPLRNTAK